MDKAADGILRRAARFARRILTFAAFGRRDDLKRQSVNSAARGIEDFDLYAVVHQCFADVRDAAELMEDEAADGVEMFVFGQVKAQALVDFADVDAGQRFAGAFAG